MIKSGRTGEMIEARVGDDIKFTLRHKEFTTDPEPEVCTGKVIEITKTNLDTCFHSVVVEWQPIDGLPIKTEVYQRNCTLLHRPFAVGDEVEVRVNRGATRLSGWHLWHEIEHEDELNDGNIFRHKQESWRNAK